MKSVDKFGHYKGIQGRAGPPGVGFVLDLAGDYDMQQKRLRNVHSPETDNDAVNKHFLYSKLASFREFLRNKTLNIFEGDETFDVKNKRLSNVGDPVESSDGVNLTYLMKKFDETILLNSEKNAFNAGGLSLTNLKKPTEESEAVNLSYLNESLQKTLQVDASNNVDVGNRRVKNLSDPKERNDAVNKSFLKAWLEIHGFVMQRELTDAVINLRKEIHNLHKTKANPASVSKQLNNIEDSFKRNWRSAVLDEGKKQMTFDDTEKTQFKTHFAIDRDIIDSYLEKTLDKET